jgi:exonuclease SbcC
MKILHITDSHGTVKSPESRTDVYYLSFLKKMYELKYVIQQHDIKLIIHTGDLFHSARVSDKFTGQLAEIIKSYGIPMYVVPGNHDIEGYTINTLDQTKLGLLYKTGVVKELDRGKNPIQLKHQKENLNISIVGQEYYKDIDTGNMSDFEMRNNNPNANFNILAIHGYLCNSPQHPDIKCTQCKDVVTDADVILSGHFHESFEYHGADFSVYNPGSMMRVEQTAYNKTHLPQYGILEITNNNGIVQHTYTMHPFKVAEPSEKVFDYTLKNQKKKTLITLENFKNSIANTNFNSNLNTSIENIINNVAGNLSVTQDIIDKTIDVYHDALNNSPDKLEVQQGYIADVSRKIIKRVEIKNFQSHEHTVVEFKDGLNTIIGESNSGKTSILRAIRWCLDNDPKGSDFITTGRDDCSVTVVFDDDTSIVRKRTRNDSGTYDVVGKTIQPDGTVSKWTQTYKGFANNLPIEIMNIHQMPKINLTKDICTHLNMMSQLDGPFLVTESPQVKAAIIGRLTGTQIIDLGIKETNKKILSNSKTIKTYTQEKTDRENELFRYQYLPFYERYVKGFDLICKYCESKMNVITNVEMTLDELHQRRKIINDITNNIVQIQNNIDMYNIMLAIKTYMAKQLEIIDMYNELKDVMLHVNSLQKQIKWLIVLTSFRPFVDSAKLETGLYGQLMNSYARATLLHQQMIDNTTLRNNLTVEIATVETTKKCFSDIYKYAQVLLQDISNTKGLYDKYVIRRQNANQQNDIAIQWNVEVNHLTSQIEELINQQKQMIKQNNICPCCGQKITSEEHVLNINNFMKGK